MTAAAFAGATAAFAGVLPARPIASTRTTIRWSCSVTSGSSCSWRWRGRPVRGPPGPAGRRGAGSRWAGCPLARCSWARRAGPARDRGAAWCPVPCCPGWIGQAHLGLRRRRAYRGTRGGGPPARTGGRCRVGGDRRGRAPGPAAHRGHQLRRLRRHLGGGAPRPAGLGVQSVRISGGSARQEGLTEQPTERGRFCLTELDWLVPDRQTRVVARPTEDLIADGSLWRYLPGTWPGCCPPFVTTRSGGPRPKTRRCGPGPPVKARRSGPRPGHSTWSPARRGRGSGWPRWPLTHPISPPSASPPPTWASRFAPRTRRSPPGWSATRCSASRW